MKDQDTHSGYLEVHVGVDGEQDASVFHAPLELHEHRLTSEVGEERLRVHNALLKAMDKRTVKEGCYKEKK